MINDFVVRTPAVFLDRDGVIVVEKGRISSPWELEFFPYVRGCVDSLKRLGFLVIVVTNQSGVARGLFSEGELQEANQNLKEETGIDDIYYCPHHPEGVIPRYRMKCRCRKPGIGLIEQASRDYLIDIQRSWMVGDRESDIMTGKNAGLHTVLVDSVYGVRCLGQYVQPDFIAADLRAVVNVIGDSINE